MTKLSASIIAFGVALLALVGSANAATEKWSYAVSGTDTVNIIQTVADGSGGVALLWQDFPNSQDGVIWLDRLGHELYVSQPLPFDADHWIVAAAYKGILYQRSYGVSVAVSRAGTETVLEFGGYPLQDFSSYGDQRGFFNRQSDGKTITRYDF